MQQTVPHLATSNAHRQVYRCIDHCATSYTLEHGLRVAGLRLLPVSRAHEASPVAAVLGEKGSTLQGDGAWEPKDAKTQLRPANFSKDQARDAAALTSLLPCLTGQVPQHIQSCRNRTCLIPACHAC